VIGEVVRRLPLYRDPLIAAATEYSEFRIEDLVNHERAASLYLIVPYKDRERLRPLMRLVINQIVRRLTEKLAYKDGRPVSPHRRPLLLMLDEFGLLGHFAAFAEAMSHMAGFGLRACLAVQSLSQIYGPYGRNESITSNCDTTIRFTPNKIETAEEISRLVGQTSVRHSHRTRSDSGRTVSEPEVGRSLMTPDEARRMSVDEVLIFARGHHPIRAPLLEYHKQPYFKKLSAIKPPAQTDRIITRPVDSPSPVPPTTITHAKASPSKATPTKSAPTPPQAGEQLSFLKFGIESDAAKGDRGAPEGKERLL
jgi:type IV secretion system protein VirD4